jgi:isopentenyl-diphosphate delta-isomerase
MASGVIQAATVSTEAVIERFQLTIRQLRTVCFCVNASNLAALKRVPLLPVK